MAQSLPHRTNGSPRWVALALSAPFLVHAGWACAHRGVRAEHVLEVVLVALALALGPRAKRFFSGVYPVALIGLLYESMGGLQHRLLPEEVHLCDLRAREMAMFGVTVNGQPGTLHDWFQAHSSPVLDRICAIPYATFILVCVAFAIWLGRRDHSRMLRFVWCFFALNVAGFVTYHLYPAAPPWYYHAHGCIVDVQAHASEGPNLARVDAWLGFHYFAGVYGRASTVFGAMPSLHCAYACLVAVLGWPVFRAPGRVATVGFFALMCFSAVYLDHHWVLDALAGIAYCLVIVGVARAVGQAVRARQSAAVLPEGAPVAASEGVS